MDFGNYFLSFSLLELITFQESDIIQLKDSYTGIYQNFLTLYIGRGAVHKLGE